MIAGLSAVAAVSMWLRRRKSALAADKEAEAEGAGLVETASSMLSSTLSSLAPAKQAAYEPPRAEGLADITAACRRIEDALSAAEGAEAQHGRGGADFGAVTKEQKKEEFSRVPVATVVCGAS